MINLFEVCVNLIEEFVIILFLTLYLGCKYKGWKKYAGFLSVYIIAFMTLTFLNSKYIYEGFLGLIFIALYFLYALMFLHGDIYIKLFISGFIHCIVYFLSLFCILCISCIGNMHSGNLLDMTTERITLIIASKLLLIICCVILLKNKVHNVGGKRNLTVLILMPTVAEFSMVGIMQMYLTNSDLKGSLLLDSLSVMFINVLVYYLFIKNNNDIKIESEFVALQQKYEYDKKYVRDIEDIYAKLSGIRHDLLQHFIMLKGLIESDTDKAKQYIDKVTKNQLSEIKHFIKTDNECFNIIVNAKMATCDKCGIEVELNVQNGSLTGISDDEISVIFGNLFDNAIEASKNSQKKQIKINVKKHEKNISIYMINSIDNSVLKNNADLKTTKKDNKNHGLGIKNIQRIVDSYSGIINYYEEEGYFCCSIIL